ncbi:MAG: hypothetical protein IKA41_07445 [Bacteroidaceae bacterium]|nr:hypothetical protein [Bacteroidaceae bacterium]
MSDEKICNEEKTAKLRGANNNNVTPFDKSQEYRSEVYPIIRELIKICSLRDIPMFVSCCIQNDESGTVYKHSSVTADTHGLTLSKDFFPDFALVTLGGRAKIQLSGPVNLSAEDEGVVKVNRETSGQKYAFDFEE